MTESKSTFPPVEKQLELIERGAVDLTTRDELVAKLRRSAKTGRPLVVKVGFDPTAPDIHLGHAVLLRKMRQFQDLGHRVIFLIGDFTGMIGDPSGRSKTRPPLTAEEIRANAETYRRQCFKILDPDKTEIRFNSEWLGALGAEGFIRLAARYNVARMLERNDFKNRFQAGQSISIHEFLYPLAQAYDSVALKADVELGGTDQLFNLNVGRDIMPSYELEPQVVLTVPLLEGLDGVEKMSKSLGNYVGVEEPPKEIFGKLMSISDDLMWRYYELCSNVPMSAVARMREMVRSGELHPKKAKEGLALGIITELYDEREAQQALAEFRKVFAAGGTPDEMPEIEVPAADGAVSLPDVLLSAGLVGSKGEASRLLRQGAVRVDGKRHDSRELVARSGATCVLKVGKRRFARIRFV